VSFKKNAIREEGPPFSYGPMTVSHDWIDYNGHLNMAYYHVLFDSCVDEFFEWLELGEAYLKRANASYFTAEAHVCYVSEIMAGDPVRVSFQVLQADAKKVHGFQELRHGDSGQLCATSEHVHIHVDMQTRRAVPLAGEAFTRLGAVADSHACLDRSDRVGRAIAIRPPSNA